MHHPKNNQNKSKPTRLLLSIELLKTFSNEELDQFYAFINCAYFNTNKNLCKLLKLLRHYVLNDENLTDDIQLKIYESIVNKGGKVDCLNHAQKKELNRLLNNLLALAEEFLAVARLKKQKDKQHELLFAELIERKQLLLYNRRLKTLQKELNTQQKRGSDFYTKQYKLEYYKANILYIENKLAKEDNFDDLQYHLDVKYILEKLNSHLAKISLMNAFGNKVFDLQPFEAISSLIELPQYSNNPLIRLLLLNIELLEKEDDQTFINLSKAIADHEHMVSASLLKPFYTNLTNYCVKQIMKGKLSFYKDLIVIYKNMDHANLLVIDDLIDVGLLKNIVTNACRIKEFIWANKILEKYKNNIRKNNRESVFKYNLAVIAFNQQQYKEALGYFNQVKKIDETHEIGIKITTLKCFYETDLQYEFSTQQAIDSRIIFFRKNKKLPIDIKKGYENFIRIFNKLYNLKNIPNKSERCLKISEIIPKLRIELDNITPLRRKQWLLTKINNLEKECM